MAYDIIEDLPYYLFYIRFKSPREDRGLLKLFSDLKVIPVAKSFKQMKSIYSTKLKLELCSDYRHNMSEWNAWQQSVLRYMGTKASMGCICWVHHGYKTKEFMALLRHITLMDSVIVTNQSILNIIEMIKKNVIIEKQQKQVLVLNLPESRELNPELFEFLEQIRMGVISDHERSYVLEPMNIIVFSTNMPNSLTRKKYEINLMSINSIYDLE